MGTIAEEDNTLFGEQKQFLTSAMAETVVAIYTWSLIIGSVLLCILPIAAAHAFLNFNYVSTTDIQLYLLNAFLVKLAYPVSVTFPAPLALLILPLLIMGFFAVARLRKKKLHAFPIVRVLLAACIIADGVDVYITIMLRDTKIFPPVQSIGFLLILLSLAFLMLHLFLFYLFTIDASIKNLFKSAQQNLSSAKELKRN